MNVKSVIKRCLGLDGYALQNFADENYKKVRDYMENSGVGADADCILNATIFTCVAIDGKLSNAEYDFIAGFIGGFSREEILQLAGDFYTNEAQETTRMLVKALPREIRQAYISLCAAVLAVDKRVDGAEMDYLKSLL